MRPVDLSKLTAVLINNALGLPLVALLLVPTGEAASWHTLRASDPDGAAASAYTAAGAYALVVASCVAGLAIGWAGVNAQARAIACTLERAAEGLARSRMPHGPCPCESHAALHVHVHVHVACPCPCPCSHV